MILSHPFCITSRLLAGVKVGKDSFISIEFAGEDSDGRTIYRYYIDTPDFEEMGSDLKSGCGGGGLESGMGNLLSFLGACAESWAYNGKDGENSSLFSERVAEWALANRDELSMLQLDIEESEVELITE